MPQLGLTTGAGIALSSLVEEGDLFDGGQAVFELETDKATVAVRAHQAGPIERLLVRPGPDVPVGTVLEMAVAPDDALAIDWRAPQASARQELVVEQAGQAGPLAFGGRTASALRASRTARAMARGGSRLGDACRQWCRGQVVAADVTAALGRAIPGPLAQAGAHPVAASSRHLSGLGLR